MKKIKIKGTVKYLNMEGGFWGIVSADGQEFRPVEMPEQLKHDGEAVEVTLLPVEEEMSLYMWGQPVKLITFHTLNA
ncbi:MAG: hypothetical protein KI786_20255 [Mameliella sp.]|nr:hypothetical protein [Phaeodactylibacter sp.]